MSSRNCFLTVLMLASVMPWAGLGATAATSSNSSDDGMEGLAVSDAHRAAPESGRTRLDRTRPVAVVGPSGKRNTNLATQATHLDRGPVFIENRGQFDSRVRYRLAGRGTTLWLTNQGVTFDALRVGERTHDAESPSTTRSELKIPLKSLMQGPVSFTSRGHSGPDPQNMERLVFSEEFVAADAAPRIEAAGRQPGVYNYFAGKDPKKWVTHVAAYSEITYRDLWPGIDLRLYRNGSDIEQEFAVNPGADLTKVQVAYKGIDGLKVTEDGTLVIRTAFGELRETKPRIYQEIAGQRVPVEGRFKLISEFKYSFEVKSHQPEYALVVDPTLLYSTFLGGSAGEAAGTFYEQANGIAVDSSGNAYVIGSTLSQDLPTTAGSLEPTLRPAGSNGSAFVTKLNPLGSQLVYSTYLEASGSSSGQSIAVDPAGEAYVAGWASDYPGGGGFGFEFPTTPNAFQTGCSYAYRFMTKLDANGDALVYSTCFGSPDFYAGDNYDGAAKMAIALDSSGRAFVAGTATSAYGSSIGQGSCTIVPTNGAYQSTCPGGLLAPYLVEFDPAASGSASLLYATYLGGTTTSEPNVGANAVANSVAVDSYGNAYVTGYTNQSDFPVTAGAYQTALRGVENCFIAKLNPTLSGAASLIYSTYLGGSSYDHANGIAVDSLGNSYVAGRTNSNNFPTTLGALQSDFAMNGNPNLSTGFVTQLNASGSNVVYSSMLGNPTQLQDTVNAIALDSVGNVYVTGATRGTGLPVTPDAFQTTNRGGGWLGYDAFVTKFNPAGRGLADLLYSSLLGGDGEESGNAIAVDAAGDAYLTGYTTSSDFPVTPNAFQPFLNPNPGPGVCDGCGPADAFVAKFPLSPVTALATASIAPAVGGNAGTVTAQIIGTGFHAGATVTLACSQSNIQASNTVVGTEGRTISASFNLAGASPGACDVVVTNPDGSSATLSQGFTVQQGGAPDVHIHKIGSEAVVGRNINYVITLSNAGNTDSSNDTVSEFLDQGQALLSVSPAAAADIATLNADSFILWNVPQIAAGQALTFLYTVQLDPSTPVGSTVNGTACFNVNYNALTNCLLLDLKAAAFCVKAATTCAECAEICAIPLDPLCPFCVALGFAESRECAAAAKDALNCVYGSSQGCDTYGQTANASRDPNELTGPSGAGSQGWIPGQQPLSYIISFENDGTAPAQQVVVTLPLSSNLNMSTLSLPGIILPNGTTAPSVQVPIPAGFFNPAAGLNEFTTNVDLRPSQNLMVLVDAKLNPTTRVIIWTFTSIDPATGQPPSNAGVGFLPPGAEADVFFTVNQMQGLTTGAQFPAQATVVFDVNPPMTTQIWLNTLDNTPPTSNVLPLPPDSSVNGFTVQWTGSDIGSGIQGYTIYVSDEGAPFTVWQQNTPATSATFTGQLGHTYGFYSIATDLVGNVEAAKTTGEATTLIGGLATPTVTFTGAPASAVYNTSFTVSATTNASTTAVITAIGACSILGNTVTMTSGTGTCSLTASWAADSVYLAATASQSTAALKAASTATITSTTPNPSAPGQAVVVSFRVAGNGSPTGTVTIAASTGETCNGALTSGAGNCQLIFLSVGSRTLAATYSGDTNFNGAVSPAVNQSVNGSFASVFPSSINFGTVYLATITVKSVTVINQGNAALTISDPFLSIVSGGNSKEFVAVNFCPKSLAAGKSCKIEITFIAGPFYAPQTATLSVKDNAYNSPQTVALTATVINPQAWLSTMSLNFGKQKVSTTSAAKVVTLKNTGATPLTITSIAVAGTNPSDFAEGSNCPLSPASLAASASCTVNITFEPTAKGSRSGIVVITDNAQFSPQKISLSGTGN